VTKAIFDAFRDEGFGIGAYFSKADWHSPGYWDPVRPALDRNPNYDTAAEPKRWEGFVRYTHAQIEELMSNYGRIDILWLDAGQVRPPRQDIRMDDLAAMARRHQPDLIIVDRTAGTKHENYRTPEQQVPDKPLSYPWETCMTMGSQWSYKPDDNYKSTRQLIQLLVDIVAKGGNFLLNVGPSPDGTLPGVAVSRLEEIGRWMDVNAEAIHGTRPITPYKSGRVAFTSRGRTVYAIYLAENGRNTPPATITLPKDGPRPTAGSELHLLGVNEALRWSDGADGVTVHIPGSAVKDPPCEHAWVVRFDN
jgi:alpha-L-fucosidase